MQKPLVKCLPFDKSILATSCKTLVGIYNHVSRKCNIKFSEPVVLTLVSLHGPLQMSRKGEKVCCEHTYPHAVDAV